MDAALSELYALTENGIKPNVAATAKEHLVNRTTLYKRFQGLTVGRDTALEARRSLSREQEEKLVKYISFIGMEGYGKALFVDTGVLQKVRELEQLQAGAKEREEQEKAQRARERAEARELKAAETLRKRQERQAAKDARMAAKARKEAEVAARKAAAHRKDDDDDDDDDYVEERQPRRSTRQAIGKNN
ncbi:hypothetical protein K470DRAFT_276784 [Piedraia hortae CBS 480.64]|uniref:Uncharacterized protein n=1 Tax=Piedraia hortae CBS 480.64 TaxID=1314780 RepID=A0A6A7BZR1_9PEZI|nr:hypothetical protein K470DRAFT_276784 [Piedraia hortae CBS 480.64]